jgi:hypothetical protein
MTWHGIRIIPCTGRSACFYLTAQEYYMSMQDTFRKSLAPVAAALVFAMGTAHAVTPPQQSAEKPVDCKKTPDHERCKAKK